MREIKFRVRDKVTKKIIDWKGMLEHWNFKAFQQPYHEFMQFTGLKDKNGVEIYEGDIVKFLSTKDGFVPLQIQNNFEVIWNNDESQWWLGENIDITWLNYVNYEVIGNIYENKELLKE